MTADPQVPRPATEGTGLVEAVQANCDIADARHATDLPLCIYLLQMREFYRWEQGLPFGAPLPREAVGLWIAERESTWNRLETQAFGGLPHPSGAPHAAPVAPFDVETMNERLAPMGLAYGAGLVGPDRPAFFLADLDAIDTAEDGLRVQVCGREHARGLLAPPASLQGDTIVLRQESLARWLWEKYEAFGVRRAEGPFKSVVEAYRLDDDFHAALPRLVRDQGRTLVLHEVGEHRAGRWLGPAWAEMHVQLDDRRAELFVRAVRDQIADLETTLPTLLHQGADESIHFWFAAYDGIRARLFPSLEAAYAAWCAGDRGRALQRAAVHGARHFRGLAEQVLALHARHGHAATPLITRLLTAPAAECP